MASNITREESLKKARMALKEKREMEKREMEKTSSSPKKRKREEDKLENVDTSSVVTSPVPISTLPIRNLSDSNIPEPDFNEESEEDMETDVNIVKPESKFLLPNFEEYSEYIPEYISSCVKNGAYSLCWGVAFVGILVAKNMLQTKIQNEVHNYASSFHKNDDVSDNNGISGVSNIPIPSITSQNDIPKTPNSVDFSKYMK